MKGSSLTLGLAIGFLGFAGCGSEPQSDPEPVLDAAGGPGALSGDRIPTERGDLTIHPIAHATLAMDWDDKTIYVDPVGGEDAFAGLPRPDLILVTDIHGDHFDAPTLEAVTGESATIVAPAAVIAQLPEQLTTQARALANGETLSLLELDVAAVPMYNLTADRLQYHEKGRGNGYVVTLGGTRVYISGDTEDIPEMRALEDIDVAFVCFNLPYTMTEDQAASAVIEFAPTIVYPYHYQGSDVERFRALVAEGGDTEVRIGGWY